MPKSASFLQNIIRRIDRIDRESLQNYIRDLAAENNLYQEILQELPDGILLLTPDGYLQWMNPLAARWLGIRMLPASPASIFDLLEDPFLLRFFRESLANMQERKVEDFHLANPREIYLRVFLIPLEKAEPETVLAILIDRSQEKTQEVNADRLARIESLISLAAGFAHEIGNPLNSLSIHLQLLKKEIKDLPISRRKVIENSLAVMNAEAVRLDRIVKNFLKASRKPPLRFRPQNLNEVLEEAIQFMEPETRAARVKVSFRVDSKLPLFLLDRERLYQAFINLIKNAVEAMAKGGLLKIQVSHHENIAAIRFEDQGSGIDDRDLPHIFDAYYTTKEGGSGLGLMTVFNTVSEHGGRIDVASKVGKGTSLTLFLPIRQPKLQLPKPSSER